MKAREVIARTDFVFVEGAGSMSGMCTPIGHQADAIIAALDAAGFRIYDTATHIAISRATWELACRSLSANPSASQES